jgi:MFS family permease
MHVFSVGMGAMQMAFG